MQPVVCLEFLPAVVQSSWFKHHEEEDDEAEEYQSQGDIDLHGYAGEGLGQWWGDIVDEDLQESEEEGAEEDSGGAAPASDDEHADIPHGVEEAELVWIDS